MSTPTTWPPPKKLLSFWSGYTDPWVQRLISKVIKISIYSSEYLPNHLPIFYILLSTLSKLPKTRLVFSWVAASTEQLFFIQILITKKTAVFYIGNFLLSHLSIII